VVPPFPGHLAAVGRCRWSGRARGRAHDWAAAALRLLAAAMVTTVCARTARCHRCSGASRRALARGWTLKYQPSFPEDGCGSNSALKHPRHVHACTGRLHAARRVEAGDDNSGLLRWAGERKSTVLAMSGGRKKRRCPRQQCRTYFTVLICEARFSRAGVTLGLTS
jgi:hypothetical protein